MKKDGIAKELQKIPVVALRGLTVMPEVVINFDVSRMKSKSAIEEAMKKDEMLLLVTQRNMDTESPNMEELFSMGTLVKIRQITKLPNEIIKVMAEGLSRARILSMEEDNEAYLQADIEVIESQTVDRDDPKQEAMLRHIKELFVGYLKYYPKVGKTIATHIETMTTVDELLDQIIMNLPVSYVQKQEVLETVAIEERYKVMAGILSKESEIARLKNELTGQIRGRVEKNQREYILREQYNYIKEELGENNSFSDAAQFEEALGKLKATKEVKEKIAKEISRFKSISTNSSESAVGRGYIETLLELPWDNVSKDRMDITKAEVILNKQHYGLEKVKERILEFLAVRVLTQKGNSPIICLVGPPGTGKTSIAKSVAESLNKEYVRICLGGVRDEAEIRGHRKTYIGAMPGRIANGLKQAGVKNPLMLLDEIDKVSSDHKGDTSSALLEVLDSEQNSKFRDHYIEIPIDLSEVLFLATANAVNAIPRPLLDRMEIIEVTSYTANEKFHIAKEHLLEKQLMKNGLNKSILSISDSALQAIIASYTKEAGVRDLERKIGEIARKAAREILQKDKKSVKVSGTNIRKYLGKEKYTKDKANENNEIGIVRGLAWTSVGGDTLQIEVNVMPGKGDIELTGQLGDVMKESAKTGISYIRSISSAYKISAEFFKKHDFHIHIPEGAVPKDGPSAGITMATALLSAITETKIKAEVAMTGEITLRGRVLPIGGLKEKVLAAKVAGIKTVIVPKANKRDIEEISDEITEGIEIAYAETMDDVWKYAVCDRKATL